MRIAIIAAAVLALAGCETLTAPMRVLDEASEKAGEVKDKTLNAAAKSIDRYCDKVDVSNRLKLRDALNARTEKGDIVVTCVED